ncbi:hypothetical protein JTE90_002156 [Oedothorax gibbosus]|uniref:BEN domain-containing protein n=1 Tax=Oedothorax gibbosus TaxID=931172 RepID=A0AAV6V7S8_9ARAC|nr:hypothetical protein JTE90_002156 [Oedothorax gibbosus]
MLEKVLWRVKPGQVGDSLFVKNLAVAVFGEDILMSSSVTGTKCNAKKGSVAKPGLCEKKMEYIKKLFHDRIADDRPSEEEKTKRLSKLNTFVAEKIFTLIRKAKV